MDFTFGEINVSPSIPKGSPIVSKELSIQVVFFSVNFVSTGFP